MPFTIKKFVMSPFSENTYIIYNEDKVAVLIDPGCNTSEAQNEILDFIKANKLQLQYIWLTHTHLDHIFGLKFFAHHYQLKPHIHKDEIAVFEYAFVMAKQMGFTLERYEGAFNFVDESTKFFTGDDEISVLHIPGHSLGSIAFYCEKQNFIISGDILFHGSIGRTDLKYSDYDTIEKSIKQKLYNLPKHTIVYCGHHEETYIGEESIHNPFVKL